MSNNSLPQTRNPNLSAGVTRLLNRQQTPAPSTPTAVSTLLSAQRSLVSTPTTTRVSSGRGRSPTRASPTVSPQPQPVITPVVSTRVQEIFTPTPARGVVPTTTTLERVTTTQFVDERGNIVDTQREVTREVIDRPIATRTASTARALTPQTRRDLFRQETLESAQTGGRVAQQLLTEQQRSRQIQQQLQALSTVQPVRRPATFTGRAEQRALRATERIEQPVLRGTAQMGIFSVSPLAYVAEGGVRTFLNPLQSLRTVGRTAVQSPQIARELALTYQTDRGALSRFLSSPAGIPATFGGSLLFGGAIAGTGRALTPRTQIRTTGRLPQQDIRFTELTQQRQIGRGTFDTRQSIPTPAGRTTTLLEFQETPAGLVDRALRRRVQTQIFTSPEGRTTIIRRLGRDQDILVFGQGMDRARLTRIRGDRRLRTRQVRTPDLGTDLDIPLTRVDQTPRTVIGTAIVDAELTSLATQRAGQGFTLAGRTVRPQVVTQDVFTANIEGLTFQQFQARTFPASVRQLQTGTFIDSSGRTKALPPSITGIGAEPTRIRLVESGVIQRERLVTRMTGSEKGILAQDIVSVADPVQRTVTTTGLRGTIRVDRQVRTLGKRGQVSLLPQRTQPQTIVQDVRVPTIQSPQATRKLRITRRQPVLGRQRTPFRTIGATRFFLGTSASAQVLSLSNLSRGLTSPVSALRPATQFRQVSALRQQIPTAQLGFSTISSIPRATPVGIARLPTPLPAPAIPPVRPPRLDVGGLTGRRRRQRTRSRRGFTRSLAGLGQTGRQADVWDIGSGLTARF